MSMLEGKAGLRWGALVMLGVAIASGLPALDRALTRGVAKSSSPPPATIVRAPAQPQHVQVDARLRPAPGRWRLAKPQDLSAIGLPLSQILIAHRDATPGFSLSSNNDEHAWLVRVAPKPERTRAEARALAERLRERIATDPSQLAQLAERHSDDLATRALGGRLGMLAAAPLHPTVLDAVSTLRAGEVSTVFETGYGFHIWKLDPPPEREQVSAERVVIPYRGAAGPIAAGAALSRAQAFALAGELIDAARRTPGALLALGRARAPHIDPVRTGSIGTWSTWAIGPDRDGAEREIDALSRLPIDTISEPIEGPYGVQVFRRTAAGAPGAYAFEGVYIRFDPAAPAASEQSKERALAFAREMLAELAHSPQRFAELKAQYCCERGVQWTAGWKRSALAAQLERLAIGELADAPFEDDFQVIVPRRTAPGPIEQPEASAFELPRPERPNLAWLVEAGDGIVLARTARELAPLARANLQLSGARAAALDDVLSQLASVLEPSAPGPERGVVLSQGLAKIEAVLGPVLFQQFTAFMNDWLTARLIGPQASVEALGP